MIWILVALCLLVAFIFSGIEAGILSLNRVRLRHRVKLREPAAMRLNALLATPERLLVTVLVVTNLATIFAVVLVASEFVRAFDSIGYVLAFVVFLPVYVLGLELLPKSLFRHFPYRALAALARLLQIASFLLWPLHWVGETISRLLFGKRPASRRKIFAAREDFKYLTIETERSGTLTPVERKLIHNVVDFRAIAAKDVMIQIEQVRTIPGSAPVAELAGIYRERRFDRWPVRGPNDTITGLIDVLDLALAEECRGTVANYQRRIVRVAPNEPAYSVLQKLRAARSTMAAVLEPGGQLLGIVTWEDLIRRLVSSAVV